MGEYDIMQVCLKGHKITEFLASYPQNGKEHCDKCGEKTISECIKCKTPIRGHYHVEGVISFREIPLPRYCHKCGEPYPWADIVNEKKGEFPISQSIENIFLKLHEVIKQFRKRYNNRDTLDVQDEYDVQDLLHSLLRLFFDDIVQEDTAPKHAGNSTRIDFVLPFEKIAIETKMTRPKLDNKKLAHEIIEDKEYYKKHPNCKTLYVLVYDPESRIDNPRGFERDLSEKNKKLECVVFIVPR